MMSRQSHGGLWRVTQFVCVLMHRHNPEIDRRLRLAVLNDAQWRLLERLPPFDRAHHLGVRDTLVSAGQTDPDVLLAAALHDVGKADERGRVRLVHRVLNVLAPQGVGERWATAEYRTINGLAHGMYLARHHARLGAQLVLAAGASTRCAELIARHESTLPVDDGELAALIQADARTAA